MSIKQVALKNAIKLLCSIRADFQIKFEGETFGELVIEPPVTKIKRSNNFRDLYAAKLNAMASGDVAEFEIESEKAELLRSALTGSCSKAWGNKTYMTSITAIGNGLSKVELLKF